MPGVCKIRALHARRKRAFVILFARLTFKSAPGIKVYTKKVIAPLYSHWDLAMNVDEQF